MPNNASTEHKPTERVLDILELLASNPAGLTLTEISTQIKASKSTILPIMHTLAKRRFAAFDDRSYRYTIGLGCYCIGSAYTSSFNALDFIRQQMRAVVKETAEICQLGLLDKNQVLYVAKEEAPDDKVRIVSYVGKRLPAYTSAIGKALLSNKSRTELQELYPDELEAYTAKTITSLDVLKEELLKVQKLGYSEEFGEYSEDTRCIAVPLRRNGEVILAISVSVPAYRMTDEKKENIIRALLEAQQVIEIYLKNKNISADQLVIYH
ncbi:MAG: IclR family transcriptional regulator [Proteobacteria bacterium]|uniref:IclR family transcriptional regulator n=1 Tax=Candidatus Avisuccinivibrio stercorigallinarum TaxID=2840704 RepID=A0A9D9DD56_9GAMM|nr:IclR family transcriptional regulator [Candidatus Avisuccinivibrio stercorigallinarum]